MQNYKFGYLIFVLCWLVLVTGFLANGNNAYAMYDNVIITLNYDGKSYVYNAQQNLPKVSNFRDSQKLQKHNRLGSSMERAEKIEEIMNIGFDCIDAIDYVLFGFEEYYTGVKSDIECEVKDAEVIFQPQANEKFRITEERLGKKLIDEQVIQSIIEGMRVGNSVDVELKPRITMPRYTSQEMRNWTRKLSSFSTNYQNSTEDRKHNVRRALGKSDGMVVQPNQQVSFNTTTGRRTKENGYREAKIIQDKEYIEAFGGGVCQSSTTLYNALILAGVEIREVHPHSLAPNYIEYGFDAMVNYGTSDLKFCNTSNTPIFIHTMYTDSDVTVEVYGKGVDNYIRKRVNEVIEKIPPEAEKVIVDVEQEYTDKVLYTDEEWYKVYPKNGYKVVGYMEYYDGDKLLNKKKIREVRYYPVQGVKIKGARERMVENKVVDLSNWNTLDKLLA